MDLLILIFFLGLVTVVSILMDRSLQRRSFRRQQKQANLSPAANAKNATLVDQVRASWHKRMGWHSQLNTELPKLRAWLIAHLADHSAAQTWVAGLTDTEFSTLQQQLDAFCTSLQIDLAWVVEQQLTQDPTLQATVQAIVRHYVQAQQQAASVQADLQAFKTYMALEQRPYSYEHQALIQQLYIQLVKDGLTAPARPEALLATEKIRIEHMLRAVQAAANADRPAFYRVLSTLSNTAQHAGTATSAIAPTPSNNQTMSASIS